MLPLPRPAGFQIHLSTALLLMVVAGGWMWLNTIPSKGHVYITLDSEEATLMIGMDPTSKVYGWPMSFIERFVHPLYPEYNSVQILSGAALAIDLAVGMVVVFVAYFVGERRVRKRRSTLFR